MLFRVRWVGYTAADDTWIAFSDMNAALGREACDYMKERGLLDSATPDNEGQGDVANPFAVGEPDRADQVADADGEKGGTGPDGDPEGDGEEETMSQSDERLLRLAARQERMGEVEGDMDEAQSQRIRRELE